MGRPGMWEILIILIIVLLLFKAKNLPEIARSLGKSIKEFKNAGKEAEKDVKSVTDDKENG